MVAAPVPTATKFCVVVTFDLDADATPVLMTEAVCTRAMPFTVAETLLPSMTVELSVPVAIPFASVYPAG